MVGLNLGGDKVEKQKSVLVVLGGDSAEKLKSFLSDTARFIVSSCQW